MDFDFEISGADYKCNAADYMLSRQDSHGWQADGSGLKLEECSYLKRFTCK